MECFYYEIKVQIKPDLSLFQEEMCLNKLKSKV